MTKKSKKLHSSEKNALLRASNESLLREYFLKVRELVESGELYPVDFDEVWPLVYSFKHKAVEALKKDLYPVLDYVSKRADIQRFTQKGEISKGGDLRSESYKLTVFALEWFVARRSKAVFKVYREVFHSFAQAMTPIGGVYPIFHKGRVYYNYNEICKSLGFYPDWHRKKRMPMHFSVVYRTLFITPALARLLAKESEFRQLKKEMLSLQTSIPFPDDDTQG